MCKESDVGEGNALLPLPDDIEEPRKACRARASCTSAPKLTRKGNTKKKRSPT